MQEKLKIVISMYVPFANVCFLKKKKERDRERVISTHEQII